MIHNLSDGVLECYYDIRTLAKNKKVFALDSPKDAIYLDRPTGKAVIVFNPANANLAKIKLLQKNAIVYSAGELPLPKGKETKEVVYDLEKVLSPDSYEDSKQRYNRLKAPKAFMRKNNAELVNVTESMLPFITKLHDNWLQNKKNDPTVFQMMLPGKRYIRCVENSLKMPNYLKYALIVNGKIESVRILYRKGEWAFDLAFFSNTWDGISQLSNAMEFITFEKMYELGIRYVNCGMPLNKKLSAFKQHYPCYHIKHFMYSKG